MLEFQERMPKSEENLWNFRGSRQKENGKFPENPFLEIVGGEHGKIDWK